MTFPTDLLTHLDLILRSIPFRSLEKAAQELSEAYRMQSEGRKSSKPFMLRYEHKLAYLALRMPATYAAIFTCLSKIHLPIHSLLDLGSGPGTLFWAARELFSQLEGADLIERDQELIAIGRQLLLNTRTAQATYTQLEMSAFAPNRTYDLVAAAYALSELSSDKVGPLIQSLWKATNKCICIIEPGTPYGFARIHQVRQQLISLGATILAPCTHEARCPLADGPDWCHFAVRLQRTELQRKVKNATLGYEDEKYSYIIATKIPISTEYGRILKTPEKHSGHVRLMLCTSNGLEQKVISRRDREQYNLAKKLEWGDAF